MLDFEKIFGKQITLEFPVGFSDKVIGKLSRHQLKLPSVSNIISKIEAAKLKGSEDFINILALHLIAYQFDCVSDKQNRKLSRAEISDSFIQFRDVSFIIIKKKRFAYKFKMN